MAVQSRDLAPLAHQYHVQSRDLAPLAHQYHVQVCFQYIGSGSLKGVLWFNLLWSIP